MTQRNTHQTQRTWAEISLENLAHNYHYLRSLAPTQTFIGIVKADAYGHGALVIGKKLEELGAEMLAVACVSEGISLRENGITLPILILGDTPEPLFSTLLDYNLTQTVHLFQQGIALQKYAQEQGTTIKIHLKIDTGMGRLGFFSEETEEISHLCSQNELEVEGIFTHFAQSECTPSPETSQQDKLFSELLYHLKSKNIQIPLTHTSNSGATLFHPETHRDCIRAGIALYGYSPNGEKNDHLKPILSLYTRISSIRKMSAGSAISYNGTHRLEKESLVAVLPVGYGDGYSRHFSQRMEVELLGKRCPILGRVCMDMTMIDVTSLGSELQVGEVVTLYDGDLLEIAAKRAETITYELLCQLTPRVPRIIING